MNRKAPAVAVAAALLLAATVGISVAAWLSVGGSSGTVAATGVQQASAPGASATGSTVTLSWGASTLADGSPVGRYDVVRHSGPTSTVVCAGTNPTRTCVDPSPVAGSATYGVVARIGSHWSGPESPLTPLTFDSAAPTTTAAVTPAPNAAGWSRDTVTVQLTASDGGSAASGVNRITYTLDGGTPVTITAATASFAVAGTGTHAVSYFAVDNAGNAETTKNLPVKIDPAAPLTVATPSPAANAGGWNNTDVSIGFAAADTGGSSVKSVTTRVGAGPTTTTTGSTASATVTAEGTSSVTYHATDNADNVEGDKAIVVNIDKTAPAASISPVSSTSAWRRSAQVTVSGSDALSGVASVAHNVDHAASDTLVAGTSTTFNLADGVHTVAYRSADNAGNSSAAAIADIKVDTTAPATGVTSNPAPNSMGWNNAAVSATFVAADGTSGVANLQYRTSIDGGLAWTGWTVVASTFSVSRSTDGITNVEYQATDNAGNVESPRHYDVMLDKTAPPSASISPTSSDTIWRSSNVVTVTGTDSGPAGVARVEYKVDNAADYTPMGNGGSFTLSEGSHTVTYRAVDNAGNVSLAATARIMVDLGVPTVAITDDLLAGPFNNKPGGGKGRWSKVCEPQGGSGVCGTAADTGSGIAGTTMVLKRNDDNRCWTGASTGTVWTTGACATPLSVGAGAEWYRAIPYSVIGTLELTLSATTTDKAGNSMTANPVTFGAD